MAFIYSKLVAKKGVAPFIEQLSSTVMGRLSILRLVFAIKYKELSKLDADHRSRTWYLLLMKQQW